MINRLPRWSLWAGLTVGLWLVWLVWLHSSLADGFETQRDKRDAARQKLETLQARVDKAPILVARFDSTASQLQAQFDRYHNVDELDDLVDDLTSSARRIGVLNAEVAPDLESILELDSSSQPTSTTQFQTDTLLIELRATNDFRRIGRWLDRIEERADFQHWVECRWSRAGEDDAVHFDGLVALLVTNMANIPPMNARLDHGNE
ncbi:MAG: hypothetical protein GF341_07915 [candidate division Zixibacteria bacterium]|nr:hypothetical protein [candidate division Zixibacteria bacterium]